RRRPVSRASSNTRRAIFLSSNGVGLGHVTRLLAIARRSGGRFEPIFATMAPASKIIEDFGYVAEYIPSRFTIGADFAIWDTWFRVELERLIDNYQAQQVIFDGNIPNPGLIGAVASRGDCKLAWVRRAMWGDTGNPFIESSRWFDLIIEPGEIAGARDTGVTTRRRDEATLVKPIRLLEDDDLLSREDAATALGLDPARSAVLIQLGAGSNRDIISLIDRLVKEIRRYPTVQIAVAEWAIGANQLSLWPEVTTLRGYPLCQYFNAFDFSISAAGYNTFHEVISHELPTIFIANANPTMDDQVGRAQFAQDAGAAFELPEDRLGGI